MSLKRNFRCFVLVCVLLLAIGAQAQLWSGILDPTRAIDWSNVGVPGGIPNRTTICASISASTYGSGATDATSGIQNALNACAANGVVSLSAGTFLINSIIYIPSNVTLRGAGADQTILNTKGSGQSPIVLGSNLTPNAGASINVTAGATRNSTGITVASTTGITVGQYLMITELNDSNYVTINGGEGNCTWCDGGIGYGGTRTRGQIVEVKTISGTTIGISPGLYSDYPNTPQVATLQANKYSGVENLQVYANNTGYRASFQMYACAYCWLKGVEANYTDGDYVELHWAYRNEIRDSYFSNAYNHTAGSTDSDIFIVDKTSATLVENNIIDRSHVQIMLNWGAAGNVISYNYSTGDFDSFATNFMMGGIVWHGAHPQYNLLESNITNRITPDQIWGSSSHTTLFRNWATGTTIACMPNLGRATVVCSPLGVGGSTGINGWYTFQGSRAIAIDHLATYTNLVGNLAGSVAQSSLIGYGYGTTHVAILQFPGNRSYDSVNYNMTFGYGESSDDGVSTDGCGGSTVTPCHSTAAYNTAFLHGNYTHADGNISWVSGVTQTLPASFYLSAKPVWWKSTLPYPAIGPDVHTATGPGGHATMIPAQDCYLNVMHGVEGAAGSPLTFNANSCYYSSTASTPAPPSSLTVVVQ